MDSLLIHRMPPISTLVSISPPNRNELAQKTSAEALTTSTTTSEASKSSTCLKVRGWTQRHLSKNRLGPSQNSSRRASSTISDCRSVALRHSRGRTRYVVPSCTGIHELRLTYLYLEMTGVSDCCGRDRGQPLVLRRRNEERWAPSYHRQPYQPFHRPLQSLLQPKTSESQ